MDQHSNSMAQAGAASLTPEQLQGLAQLGGMVSKVGASLNNGSGGPAASGMRWAGDLYERYDVPELMEDVLGTFKVMRDSGLLALIRDNADLVVQTVDLLKPLAAKMIDAAEDAPLERWVQHLGTADRLLTQARALSQFVDQHLAGELTEMAVKLTALAQETDAEATVTDALRAVARMRQNGTLQRLVDLSDHVALFAETVDTGALVGDLVNKADGSSLVNLLAQALRTSGVVAKAIEDAQKQSETGKSGGFGGLIKLLKDPEVQRSMRLAAYIPAYIKKENGGSLTAN
jgi:Protein of unknown function (DUF1641).